MYEGYIIHSGTAMPEDLTGEDRCWPCTVANATVGLVVAWLPVVVALIEGARGVIALAVGWAVIITGYTLYRLLQRGYLPFAEPVARATGMHEQIGPGSRSNSEKDR